MERRVEADAAVGDCRAGSATEVVETVQCDLTGTAFELLEHTRSGAEGQSEGPARSPAGSWIDSSTKN